MGEHSIIIPGVWNDCYVACITSSNKIVTFLENSPYYFNPPGEIYFKLDVSGNGKLVGPLTNIHLIKACSGVSVTASSDSFQVRYPIYTTDNDYNIISGKDADGDEFQIIIKQGNVSGISNRYQFDVESSTKSSSSDTLYLNQFGHVTWAQLLEAYTNNRPIDPMRIKKSDGTIKDSIKIQGGTHIQVIEQTDQDSSKTVTVNNLMKIHSGFGVSVVEDGDDIYLTNTLPDIDVTNLVEVPTSKYTVYWGVRGALSGVPHYGWTNNYRQARLSDGQSGDNIRIFYVPMIDPSTNQVKKVYLRVCNASGYMLSCGASNRTPLAEIVDGSDIDRSTLLHSNGGESGMSSTSHGRWNQFNKSIILGIKFTDDIQYTYNGHTYTVDIQSMVDNAVANKSSFYDDARMTSGTAGFINIFNATDSQYQQIVGYNHFQQYDFGGNDIWNMKVKSGSTNHTFRGSWPAVCELRPQLFPEYYYVQGSDIPAGVGRNPLLTCHITSLGDGFNNRFSTLLTNSYTGNGYELWMEYSNFSVGGVLIN